MSRGASRLGWLTSRSSLGARIFWYLAPIFLVLFALVGVANVQLQRNLAEEQFRKRGVEIATNLAYSSELGVLAASDELLESSLRSVVGDPDVAFILVYDAAGTLLAEGGLRGEDRRAPAALPDAERARLEAEGRAFWSEVATGHFVEFYAPILSEAASSPDELLLGLAPGPGAEEDATVGFVRVGLSLAAVERNTAALLRLWAGLAAVFLVLAGIAIYFISQRISRPIKLLTQRAKDISSGNLDHTIPVESRDEIGQLGSTFNEMAQALKSNVSAKERALDDLQDLNRTLEVRVRESTTQLEELYRLSASMQEPLSLREALSRVLDGARQLVGIDRLCIWALSREGEALVTLCAAGVPDEEFAKIQGTEIPLGDAGPLAQVLNEGAALVYDASAWEPVVPRADAPDQAIPSSLFLLLPVLARGGVIGVLGCDNQPSGRPIGEGTFGILRTFAAHAGSAIENAKLFQELDEQSREIEAANRHKSEFLANMSHELRTPLNAVIGFSEVLLERMFGDLNDKQADYLADILAAGRHLLSLINDILDLSKIEAGHMELSPSTFALHAALDNAVTLIKERAQKRGLKLELDIDACPEQFVADERKLKQVLLNLLSNALKFTEEGGTISLRAAVVGHSVEFAVRDTGIGIDPSDLDRIFEAFRQAESDYVRKAEGTGLGLTLSRQIVELHGGKLWAESELGTGSTFAFTLPIRELASADSPPSPAATLAAEPAAPSVQAATGGESDFVLVVEDDAASANLLAIHLKDAGIAVRVVHDGKTGLELAKALRPRAIVLDLLLPKLDGWEFLSQLRASPETAAIPVVIVSIVEERGKGLALGADEYLIKPYDSGQLVEAVGRLYQRESAEAKSTVLAIDDDPRALELIGVALEAQGFEVIRALSGEEGIEIARQRRPDLIVLDLMMPGIDGFEVSQTLKQDPATAAIPIVVLTMRSLSAAEKRSLSGKVEHLGRKSEFSRTEFVALVRTAIKRSQSWEQGAGI